MLGAPGLKAVYHGKPVDLPFNSFEYMHGKDERIPSVLTKTQGIPGVLTLPSSISMGI